MIQIPRLLLFLIVLSALAHPLPAETVPPINVEKGAAIEGYDPVAYFETGVPTKGSPGVTFEWQGATWRFASRSHRDKFAAAPEQFAPQYGGYCAWAVSQGKTAEIDPEAWEIVDGKLYLNYSSRIQKKWQSDRDALRLEADANWPKLHDR
jgi:hypothetical protein